MTFWQKLNRFPPCLVRLLAMRNGVPMESSEIARAMGTTEFHVDHLSMQQSWAEFDARTMELFLKSCGCDFEVDKVNNRMRTYIKGSLRWPMHRKHPRWKTLYEPLWGLTKQAWLSSRQ